MAAVPLQDDDGSLHLKQVSRIKHIILQKYLPSWEVILGSRNRRLCYFDCYAGPGAYEFEGQKVDGSPIIAVRSAQDYLAKVKAQYKLHFRIRFDVEDGLAKSRTKYYLIHASNHPKAALLMKEVMWPLGDEEGLFDFSGEKHGVLFSSSPRDKELRAALLREYVGMEVEFDQLREETWDLPCRDHARQLQDGSWPEKERPGALSPAEGRRKQMSEKSTIEWTDSTWNPVAGCNKVSPGCKHCYAETFAGRWRGIPGHPYEQGFDLRLWPDRLELPLTWKKPRTIFVNSMSDLFHEKVPLAFIQRVFSTMERASWHTFQILTKRSERLAELAPDLSWPPNVWMGVSIETAKYLWRADHLRKVPAAVRFLSMEPLLGPLGTLDLSDIHWVIVGGESGPGARPIEAGWVRDIRKQCRRQRVPFFFKQWGGVQKKKNGRVLDGRTWDGTPKGHVLELELR